MLTLLEEWSVVVSVGDEHKEISGRVVANGESPITHQHLQGAGSIVMDTIIISIVISNYY